MGEVIVGEVMVGEMMVGEEGDGTKVMMEIEIER